MLEEISTLGFSQIELGHGVRSSLLEGISRFLAASHVRITSVHNFCPQPELSPHPDCFQCTSPSAQERQRALMYTLRTIDYAADIQAARVVLHLGSAILPPYTEALITRLKQGKLLDRKYVALKLQAIKERESTELLPRVLEWLQPVVAHAKAASILLGIENRILLETFPTESELRALLEQCPAEVVGYWHDFGHAQVRDHLTFVDHAELFASMLPRLIGCHVHDVRYPELDHQVPFSGCISFADFLPLIRPEIPMVWELAPGTEPSSIRDALAKWKAIFSNRSNLESFKIRQAPKNLD
jgi:sugar phosphate isomerase/epimerase